ncbi:hypothetical protein [Halocola ammonii]
MKRFTIFLLTAILFSACSWDGKFKRVKVDSEYSLDIPNFLSESNILNEVASLQYQDIIRDFYVIVIDERKSELRSALNLGGFSKSDYSHDLDGYTSIMLDSYSFQMNMKKEPTIVEGTVDNKPARFVTVEGEVENEDVFWKVAFIEGTYKFYQVYTWTAADKKDEYKITMNQVLKSFREL